VAAPWRGREQARQTWRNTQYEQVYTETEELYDIRQRTCWNVSEQTETHTGNEHCSRNSRTGGQAV